MGKSYWIFFILIVFFLGFYGVSFYWENLRGIGPALQGSPDDIAKLIENAKKIRQNTTAMPLNIPREFSISIFAKDLNGPRVLMQDAAGHMLVSVPQEGKVVALPDNDRDGTADAVVNVLAGLNKPHGLALRCGDTPQCTLFVAETDRVNAYDYNSTDMKAGNKRKIADLPSGGNHITRSLLVLTPPEGDKLLVSVGSSCNACTEDDERRAKILVMNTDGTGMETFAFGLRNAVFMAQRPIDGKVWATEMGRDLLGDNLPPDEINILEEGKNYGWPTCFGKNIHDTEYDKNIYIRAPCMEPFEMPSHIDIPAHSAPLGLAFIPEEGWPEEYWHNLLVAYHGSWNRNIPTGYKVVRYKLDPDGNLAGDKGQNPTDFITGWLVAGRGLPLPAQASEAALGRPADILALPGGVLYISDDKAGVIYRVAYISGL
ncbi:MAG: PQQ-dependent sugar dehydrogenase [Candidatus Sungbacteria bacterium]|nr:PQQ-dependent sugar dehydrogenase [Candidatus Sungbacteria bacterium]